MTGGGGYGDAEGLTKTMTSLKERAPLDSESPEGDVVGLLSLQRSDFDQPAVCGAAGLNGLAWADRGRGGG